MAKSVNLVLIHTTRSHYDAIQAANNSITVGELIDELQRYYDEDDKVVFCNDNGYTYGQISRNLIDEDTFSPDEDEEEEEDEC